MALVTGAGSGIGRATARRLAAEGACVVLADRDAAAVKEAAADIGPADVAVDVAADVTDEASIAAAFCVAALAFGGVDLVVNNAGLSVSKPLAETSAADWDLQHSVMARGSGIFAGGWGAQRAAVYGVPESELGAFYAQRTLLKREVLPEHVAAAVFVLTAGELPVTTGAHIPVDAGVAAAFLR